MDPTESKLYMFTEDKFVPLVGVWYDESAKDEEVEVIEPTHPLEGEVPLGLMDRINQNLWSPTYYVFENASAKKDFMSPALLKKSLAAALSKVPIICGKFQSRNGTDRVFIPGQYMKVVPGPGAWFSCGKIPGTFQGYKAQHFSYEVLPPVYRFKRFMDAVSTPEDAPLLDVKANYFECGSVLLMIYINHLIADGRSSYEFMKLWGRIARGIEGGELPDSRHLFRPNELISEASIEASMSLANEMDAPKETPRSADAPIRACRIPIPLDKIKTLKESINAELADSGEFVSTDDVFSAAIWKALTRARQLGLDERTCVQRPVEMRGRASSALLK